MLTAAQVQERKSGLGGSDASAVLGVNPYRAPLDVWLEKRDLAEPFLGNEKTFWGDMLEPVIAQVYAMKTGHETARTERVLRHSKHPWMLGNPDRILVGRSRGLEIKTAGINQAYRWGSGPEDCPEEYVVQCAWYMAVADVDEWDLAGLICGQELKIYTIQRDLELEQLMIESAERFWFDHVQTGVQPPIDGSESFKKHLARKYPKHDQPMRRAGAEETEWALALHTIEAEIERLELDAERLRNLLKAGIGKAAGIFGDKWKVTWKSQTDGKRPFRPWF